MFIGEAPGKKEDELWKPFVGASWKLLDEMLKSINLKRKDIFIANTVKCRPPNNRNPKKEEIKLCLPFLKEQIKIIKPQIIVTLWTFALNIFFPDKKISNTHGQFFEKDNLKFLSLYHPAFALYNGSNKEILFKEFLQLQWIHNSTIHNST